MSGRGQRVVVALTAMLLWAAATVVACGGGSTSSGPPTPTTTATSTPQAPAQSPVQAPAPPPPTSSPKTLPPIPSSDQSGGSVTGGGPGGDPAAAQRLAEQFPTVDDDITADGAGALKYASLLGVLFPELKTELKVFETGYNCAANYGVANIRFYLTRDLRAAGVIAAVSHRQAQQLPSIALKCLLAPVTGGGPLPANDSGQFSPCFIDFSIVDRTSDGEVDRYYIYAAGTNSEWCTYLRDSVYAHDNEQPISVG